MNIRRVTNYRALVLAAEAGALNMTVQTPEEEARVVELLRQAESIIEQRPTKSLVFEQMLEGEHLSDNVSHRESFPSFNFSCYSNVKSNADKSVWGSGWLGNDIISRSLSRYSDAIKDMSFNEAMSLLARMMRFFEDYHSNTGITDTEPQVAMQIVINDFIFAGKTGFNKYDRGDWSKYLKVEPQFHSQTAEA